jgi:hypothetical protein
VITDASSRRCSSEIVSDSSPPAAVAIAVRGERRSCETDLRSVVSRRSRGGAPSSRSPAPRARPGAERRQAASRGPGTRAHTDPPVTVRARSRVPGVPSQANRLRQRPGTLRSQYPGAPAQTAVRTSAALTCDDRPDRLEAHPTWGRVWHPTGRRIDPSGLANGALAGVKPWIAATTNRRTPHPGRSQRNSPR